MLIHEGITFDRETYFAILMDRAHGGPVIVASKEGGVDIEETAHKNPDAIITVFQSIACTACNLFRGLRLLAASAAQLALFSCGVQQPVDIFEGITDKQTERVAKVLLSCSLCLNGCLETGG